ncbi:MAG: GLPGLI family protein [Bacteroidetes bacterium]|nr:GLPGLI family protein [Bacteroidota bacterium]
MEVITQIVMNAYRKMQGNLPMHNAVKVKDSKCHINMMMKKFLFLLILFLISFSYAQQIEVDKRFVAPKYSQEVKDQSNLVVQYNLTFTDGKDKKLELKTILQLGDKYSKFSDINAMSRDSLIKAHSLLESVGAKELNDLGRYNIHYKKNILKDFVSNILFCQERISKTVYQYSEAMPVQHWVLTNEKKYLLGYLCKSATLTFRGRKYKAWYTEEIPKNDGPYIFQGLPGLILKITDEHGQYDFTAVGIVKKKMDIYWRNESGIETVSRENFRKIQRNYFENPGIFMSGKAYDDTGKIISIPINKNLYAPLELE